MIIVTAGEDIGTVCRQVGLHDIHLAPTFTCHSRVESNSLFSHEAVSVAGQ